MFRAITVAPTESLDRKLIALQKDGHAIIKVEPYHVSLSSSMSPTRMDADMQIGYTVLFAEGSTPARPDTDKELDTRKFPTQLPNYPAPENTITPKSAPPLTPLGRAFQSSQQELKAAEALIGNLYSELSEADKRIGGLRLENAQLRTDLKQSMGMVGSVGSP